MKKRVKAFPIKKLGMNDYLRQVNSKCPPPPVYSVLFVLERNKFKIYHSLKGKYFKGEKMGTLKHKSSDMKNAAANGATNQPVTHDNEANPEFAVLLSSPSPPPALPLMLISYHQG